MSEITRGVIGMPYELAMSSELSRRQFHSRAQALLDDHDRIVSSLTEAGMRMQAELDQFQSIYGAAPDLLQALEELDAMYARAWDTTDGGLHFSAESVAKFEAAHDKARAAIAKATGQA